MSAYTSEKHVDHRYAASSFEARRCFFVKGFFISWAATLQRPGVSCCPMPHWVTAHWSFVGWTESSKADCSLARSSFFICQSSPSTRASLSDSPDANYSLSLAGTICQNTPNLSCNQAQASSRPPSAVSRLHNASISSCVSHAMESDVASVNFQS